MAKKKKTKVGNFISKVKGKIVNAAQSVGISNLGTIGAKQPVLKARVGEGLTPEQTSKAQEVVTKKVMQPTFLGKIGLPTNQLINKVDNVNQVNKGNYPGLTGNVPAGLSFPTYGKSSGAGLSRVPSLEKASAPGTAEETISAARTAPLNLSSSSFGTSGTSATTMGVGSTAGANASVAGVTQANQQAIDEMKTQQELLRESRDKETKNIFKLFQKDVEKEPSVQEIKEQYRNELQIEQQTAEINSIQQSLDKVLTEVANQETVAKDRLGTNDFINNQIAQIRRNSEPIINQLSAELKWRSGLLAQDKELMYEAVSDALAERSRRIEDKRWLAKEYLQNLNDDYKFALTESIKKDEREYQEERELRERAIDVAWEYAQAGRPLNINPNTITWEQLAEKIARNPLPQKSSGGGGGSSSGYNFSQTQMNKGAVNAGVSLDEFTKLPGDVQNFFVSSSSTIVSDARDAVNAAKSGDLSSDEVVTILENMGATQDVIEYLTSGIQVKQDTPKQSFWSTLTKSIGSIFN